MYSTGGSFQQYRHWVPMNRSMTQCRICTTQVVVGNNGMNIFCEEGRNNFLQLKIQKYLYIEVSAEDDLSKMICYMCIRNLEGVHQFVMMAYHTQIKLRSQLCDNISVAASSQLPGNSVANMEYIQNSTAGPEDLSRSILMTNTIQALPCGSTLTKPNVEDDKAQGPCTEEMEIKIDPMLFLQCSTEQYESDNSEVLDNEEEIKDTNSQEPLALKKKMIKLDEENKNQTEPREGGTVSNATKLHRCVTCTQSFPSKISLQNHLWSHLAREKHVDGRPILRSQHVYYMSDVSVCDSSSNIACPVCYKNISTKGNLKVHLETHRPKGRYGCDICGRVFKTQSNLFRHKEYHDGIQFPCTVCGRVYPTNSTLRAHSITHSDLRPHACPLCDKTFKRNQDLKFHLNQHTGARPYQCPYCPKAFASSGNCFSHRKRMHPQEVHRDRQRAEDLMS